MSRQLIFMLVVAFFSLSDRQNEVEAEARLVKVPLQSATTDSVGSLGQPVINYYATVNVGTPPKKFNVQFDVGTNELFLPHYTWNSFNTYLHYYKGFQCKKSSTCSKNEEKYKIEYQHVKMKGKRYTDLMDFDWIYSNEPNNSILAASNIRWRQNFLAISSASDSRFSALPVDGFFGLGPASKSNTGIDNILKGLHRAGLIDNLQFSIWFNPVLDSRNGGGLILGGVDTNIYEGKIYWHHLSEPHEWTLGLQSVYLGGQSIGCLSSYHNGCRAKLSSGVSDIYGPRGDVMKIYALLNATRSPSGLYLIDCQRLPSLPSITFNIDGYPYHLYASNYIRKTVDGTLFKRQTCYVAILSSDDDPSTWTLGTPFLGAYYSIFDLTYRQIGFANLKR